MVNVSYQGVVIWSKAHIKSKWPVFNWKYPKENHPKCICASHSNTPAIQSYSSDLEKFGSIVENNCFHDFFGFFSNLILWYRFLGFHPCVQDNGIFIRLLKVILLILYLVRVEKTKFRASFFGRKSEYGDWVDSA